MKILVALFLMIAIIIVSGCESNRKMVLSEVSNYLMLQMNPDLEFKAGEVKYKLPVNMAIFKITNLGESDYTFGEEYAIEKYEDGTWYTISFNDSIAFPAIEHTIGPNKSNEFSISLDVLKHELTQGKYRVVKKFYSFDNTESTVAAEFELY